MRDNLYLLLASDEDENVRRALAENPFITDAVQKILLHDKSERVCSALAVNPNLSKSFTNEPKLKELRKTNKDFSKKSNSISTFQLSPKQRKELFDHGTSTTLAILALDELGTKDDRIKLTDILNQIIEIEGKKCELFSLPKVSLILNPKTESEILTKFKGSTEPSVQEALASNLRIPNDVLEKLSKKTGKVRCILANPNWYEAPFFLEDISTKYVSNGLKEIIKDEKNKIDFLKRALSNAHETSAIISYKRQLIDLKSDTEK